MPALDEKIFERQLTIVYFVVLVHILFSWWFYSNQQIFPTEVKETSNGKVTYSKATGKTIFATENTIPMLVFFILTCLFYVF